MVIRWFYRWGGPSGSLECWLRTAPTKGLSPPLPVLAKETMCLPCIVTCVRGWWADFILAQISPKQVVREARPDQPAGHVNGGSLLLLPWLGSVRGEKAQEELMCHLGTQDLLWTDKLIGTRVFLCPRWLWNGAQCVDDTGWPKST